ncbi:MAG: CotH kinase family protein [Bacteroidia bacterium]|nr:CotH kinase family protein [Bacteroidia bacterium]
MNNSLIPAGRACITFFLAIITGSVEGAYAQDTVLTSSNLPIIIIQTDGQPIPDEPKVAASMRVLRRHEGRNTICDTPSDFDGRIGIELRGNSSLQYEQKQYLIETRDTLNQECNVSLCEFPQEHDWILYAPYVDKSLIRNVLVYQIARDMGWYASRTRFCELVLNDRYQGVYVLLERIKRDKNRVDIAKLDSSVESGSALTGGYIIAIDGNGKDSQLGFPGAYDSSGYYVYWHIYPTSNNINLYQRWYIQDYIKAFEDMMRSSSFADCHTGYPAWLNVPSFVDYILINEVANNVDGFVASLYLHKNRDSKDGRLVAGPVWDFNIAFGNANYADAELVSGWRSHYGRVPFWWRRLLQDSVFVDALVARWRTLRNSILSSLVTDRRIDSLTALLGEAQQRHFQRWALLGQAIWPNYFVGNTWEEEISYLRNWISSRMSWMDTHIASIALPDDAPTNDIPPSEATPTAFSLTVHPQPSVDVTHIDVQSPGPAAAEVRIRDILGREVRNSTIWIGDDGRGACSIETASLPRGWYGVFLSVNGVPRAVATLLLTAGG